MKQYTHKEVAAMVKAKANGSSTPELAEQLGMSRTTLWKQMTGVYNFGDKVLNWLDLDPVIVYQKRNTNGKGKP